MQYVDPRTGQLVDTGTFNAGFLGLTATDLEALSRLAQGEVANIARRNPNDLFGSVAQMMDVVQNRAATPNEPFGSGIQGVVNQKSQFSPINGLGSWTGLPNAPAPYDSAVNTYAGLQSYGAPNFTTQTANHYLNDHPSAYANYSNKAPPAWGSQMTATTRVGTAPLSHLSGFLGPYQPAQPYSISLPDDFNISMNRDLTMVPMSYLENPNINPVGLGLHQEFMSGVPAAGIAPNPGYNPFGSPLGQQKTAFTTDYENIAEDAPSMWGGIGALPGKALDAVAAPARGLYDMFAGRPAPAVQPVEQATPYPTQPVEQGYLSPIATEEGRQFGLHGPAAPSPFAADRRLDEVTSFPSAPVGAVEQSLLGPALDPREYTDNLGLGMALGVAPEDFGPNVPGIGLTGTPSMPMGPLSFGEDAPLDPRSYTEDFGLQTALGVAPQDFAPNVPGIGLTGTPSMGLPAFSSPPALGQQAMLDNFAMAQPPAQPLGPMAMLDNFQMAQPPAMPLGPQAMLDNFAMAQPPAAAPPADPFAGLYDTPAAPPGMTMPAAPTPPTSTAPSISAGLGSMYGATPPTDQFSGLYGAPAPVPGMTMPEAPTPPSSVAPSISAGLGGMYGMTPAPAADQFAYDTPAPVPGMSLPEVAPPQSLRDINAPAAPVAPSPSPAASAMQAVQAMQAAQALQTVQDVVPPAPPEAPAPVPAAPAPAPSPVGSVAPPSIESATQPALSVPVEGPQSLLNNAPPTPEQLATATQMLAANMPTTPVAAPAPAPVQQALAPAPVATDVVPAVSVPDVATPALTGTPLAGDMALANAIATNVAPVNAPLSDVTPAPSTPAPSIIGSTPAPAPAPSPAPAPPGPAPATPGPVSAPSPSYSAPSAPQGVTSPAVASPQVADEGLGVGGIQVGDPLFAGGPPTINKAMDTEIRAMGPDYSGPWGINTGQYSNIAEVQQAGQAIQDTLGSLFGGGFGVASPNALGTIEGIGGLDGLSGGVDFGGALGDLSQNYGDAFGGFGGLGGIGGDLGGIGGDVGGDVGGDLGGDIGGDFGGEQDYTGGSGTDDSDDHGW